MPDSPIRHRIRPGLLLAFLLWAVAGNGGAAEDTAASPGYSARGADTCLMCHRDEVTAAVFKTPHGEPGDTASPFGPRNLQCEACHGPGGAHAGRVPSGEKRPPLIYFKADEPASVRNAPCLSCHETDLAAAWHDSTHRFEELACSDCHSSHKDNDPALASAESNALCTSCHRSQALDARKAYAHATEENLIECNDCHAPHGNGNEFALSAETINDTCFQCHADKRGPFLWEHSPVTEDCSTCHDAHGSNHPGMLTRRGPFLCQSCHSQSGHPSVAQEAPDSDNTSALLLLNNCMNCHSQVHGSNHPSGAKLTR